MLEITVKRTVQPEFNCTQIKLIFKQSYELTLLKDNSEIKIPTLARPVFSFQWDVNGYRKVYWSQWEMLKAAVQAGTDFKIVFNFTDGVHSISCQAAYQALVLTASSCEFGTTEYFVPIAEFKTEIIQMIDEIIPAYPKEDLPEIFQHRLEEFPVILSSLEGQDVVIRQYYLDYTPSQETKVSVKTAKGLLQWFNDRTLPLPAGFKIVGDNMWYSGGIWSSTFAEPSMFERFRDSLARLNL